jgi:ATPase family associated with various cellular activities (AAA)
MQRTEPSTTAAPLTLALGPHRAVVCSQSTVSLHEDTAIRWTARPAQGTAIAGEVFFEGRAVALLFERASDHLLVVLNVRDGAAQHRIKLPLECQVRFAARRGVALVLSAHRRLILIDLRYGRVLVDQELELDLEDAAIDPAGQRITLRLGPVSAASAASAFVEVTVADLLRKASTEPELPPMVEPELHALEPSPLRAAPGRSSPRSAPVAVDDVATFRVRQTERDPVADLPSDPFASTASLDACPALPPRATGEPDVIPTVAVETRALLEAERARLAALAARAIAIAWDRGVIAFPDPSEAPFHSEVEGVVGKVCGVASSELERAQERVEATTRNAAAAALAVAPHRPPVAELVAELGLSPLACEILWVIAAPLLWGELARLYGILANDPNRGLCDEHLVTALLAEQDTPHEIALELDPAAPLMRSGLVRAEPGPARPFLPLVVDRVALVRLRGSCPLGELAAVMQPVTATVSFADLRIPTAIKDSIVRELRCARAPLRLAVHGKPGAGRRTLLATIAAASGHRLGLIQLVTMPREPAELAEALRLALQQVHLAGVVPCVDGLDRVDRSERSTFDRLRDVFRRHPGPIALRLGRGAEVPFDPGFARIELAPLTIGERLAAWKTSATVAGWHDLQVATLADRYRIGPGVIERVVAKVQQADAGAASAEPLADRIDLHIRHHISHDLGAIADRVERKATWSQVILPSDIQDSLTELVGRIRHRRTVFESWGFDRVMSSARGVTALFQGGPGTGKTLVAGAIANELGVELYRIDVSRVMSKWIGETEQNLARLFDAAEDANAVLLFDEADSLFSKRTEVKSSVDRYANLEVNYLLQRLDTFEGIAILTTNMGGSIDGAFKRRLSCRLTFPFPDEEQRELLWRAHLPPQIPRLEALDLASLAQRYKLSGGYIRNCALRAAFLAAEEGGGLAMDHLERAIKAEYREMGKLGDGGVLE